MTPGERDRIREDRVRDLREILHDWDDLSRWMDAIRRTLGLPAETTPDQVHEVVSRRERERAP